MQTSEATGTARTEAQNEAGMLEERKEVPYVCREAVTGEKMAAYTEARSQEALESECCSKCSRKPLGSFQQGDHRTKFKF